ncbi:collagen-like protein [Microterricola pindariensis]|uniref:collagen-like protein n=1 Tax=Microterricola pindariensis TaxID=478010 RepID=UPI0010572453|nr:collagen-like protein [Microterricola pindariensis]
MTEANDRPDSTSGPVPAGTPGSAPAGAPAGDPVGKPAAAVTRATLLWIGAGVVLLAFVASFLGSSMAAATAEPAPAPTVYVTATPEPSAETPEPSEPPLDQAALDAMIAELMPTGSIVRAGVGAPSVDAGFDGDLYIDLQSANVYLRQDGVWTSVGNIKQNAAENLAGEQGEQGETGATGAQGEPGKPGKPGEPGVAGTQVSLGTGSPDPAAACGADGDIYLDTASMAFYTCSAGAWVAQQ